MKSQKMSQQLWDPVNREEQCQMGGLIPLGFKQDKQTSLFGQESKH